LKKMIEKLNRLIEENPTFPVKMFISRDEILEDFRWTEHGIPSVETTRWYRDREIYTGIDDIVEHFMDEYAMEELEATEKAMEKSIDVILIRTEPV